MRTRRIKVASFRLSMAAMAGVSLLGAHPAAAKHEPGPSVRREAPNPRRGHLRHTRRIRGAGAAIGLWWTTTAST